MTATLSCGKEAISKPFNIRKNNVINMKSKDRLGDLHKTEDEVLDVLHGMKENLGDEMMPIVIMTIGILYDYPPNEFMKRLGNSVVDSVEKNPDAKNDPEAQLVLSLLKKELSYMDGKKKDSNIGYL